jgi:hypothetical protein
MSFTPRKVQSRPSVFFLYEQIRVTPISLLSISYLRQTERASNDMPNRWYLAWLLIGPAAIAKLFTFPAGNLPPSKEGREGDCGCANPMDAYEQTEVSSKRQPLIELFLVPPSLG